jgi:hypothetical protein
VVSSLASVLKRIMKGLWKAEIKDKFGATTFIISNIFFTIVHEK